MAAKGFPRNAPGAQTPRIGKNRYSFPWELWVSRTVERVVTRRSLLTGQALAEWTVRGMLMFLLPTSEGKLRVNLKTIC